MKVPPGCIADIKFIFCGQGLIFLFLSATGPEQNVIMAERGDQSFALPATLNLFIPDLLCKSSGCVAKVALKCSENY